MNRPSANAALDDQRARQAEIAAALAAATRRAIEAQKRVVAGRLGQIGANVAGDAPLTPGGQPATDAPAAAPLLSASDVFMDGFDERLRAEVGDELDNQALLVAGALGATVAAGAAIERRVNAQKDRLDYISDRVYDEVAGSLTDAASSGATFGDMTSAVLDLFSGLDPTAEAVGRTEAGALVEGVGYSATEADAATQGWQKSWATMDDERVRDSHEGAAELGPIAADETFDVGGFPMLYPHDPDAPIEEVVNCRCWLEWVAPEGGDVPQPDEGDDGGE